MKFTIRDLFLVTVIVAVCVAWWLDRYSSRKELQRVQFLLALEEDNNKHLKSIAKNLADHNARMDANFKEHLKRDAIYRAAADESLKRAIEAYRKLGPPPLPNSSAPAPNPPAK